MLNSNFAEPGKRKNQKEKTQKDQYHLNYLCNKDKTKSLTPLHISLPYSKFKVQNIFTNSKQNTSHNQSSISQSNYKSFGSCIILEVILLVTLFRISGRGRSGGKKAAPPPPTHTHTNTHTHTHTHTSYSHLTHITSSNVGTNP